jgi:hypothetical protein
VPDRPGYGAAAVVARRRLFDAQLIDRVVEICPGLVGQEDQRIGHNYSRLTLRVRAPP